jgi:competence ComEA-like helix-hairpin-helix protein
MQLSNDDRRALGVILALLVVAAAARWVERPRPLLDDIQALDIAALEEASREARPPPRGAPLQGPIDPNAAGLQDLQRLPGVGAATAQRIIDERERGPFRTAGDLQRVRGIGPALSARLAEHLTLPPGPASPPAGSAAGSAAGSRPAPVGGGGPGGGAGGWSGGAEAGGAPAGARPSAVTGAAAAAPLNLNRASATELQVVRGIGPALAARLVARRDSLRGFRSWDDVDAVPGVGPAMLARLKEMAVLGP